MLPTAFSRALSNLMLPGIVKLLLWCLIAYIVGWGVLSWSVGALVNWLAAMVGAEGFWAVLIGSFGGGILAWFMFPLLFPVLIGFFDDYMAETIEKHDYPNLPRREPPFWPTLGQDILFTLKALGINLVMLPFYVFVPVLNVFIYYVVNGYLLGSQFFYMSAGRNTNRERAGELRYQHRRAIMLAGMAISFFATIPVLNLIVPVLGVATMLHYYHLVTGNAKVEEIEGSIDV